MLAPQRPGDASADRKLKFLKPSITLDWRPGSGWHTQAIFRRTVAQLDFYDFISSADLSSPAASTAAMPISSRNGRGKAACSFENSIFGNGLVKARARIRSRQPAPGPDPVFDDAGHAFDAPGNLGTGTPPIRQPHARRAARQAVEGLRVKLHGNLQRTRVDDPISGQPRDWSGFYPRWLWDAEIRRDIGNFAYGIALSDNRANSTFFRTDDTRHNCNGGSLTRARSSSIAQSAHQSLTLDVNDIFDTGGARTSSCSVPTGRPGAELDRAPLPQQPRALRASRCKQSFGGGAAKAAPDGN